MKAVHNFRQSEFREKVTDVILDMLSDLPEIQRNIFIWNHYCGYGTKKIAVILRTSLSEVETSLEAINSILYHRIHSLLVEVGPKVDLEIDVPATSSRETKLSLRQTVPKSVAAANGKP